MTDHPFHPVKRIEKIDTAVNFIIKCEDDDQLNALKALLKTKKRSCSYGEFISIVHPTTINCNEDHNQQLKIQLD